MNQTLTRPKKHTGLTEAEVLAQRQKYGSNQMTPPRRKGFFSHFFSNMNDPVIRVLLIALAVNLLFVFRTADWVETIGIGISVFLATFISTLSEYGSENAFSKLQMEEENFLCRVRRDGKIREIPLNEIVVGDLLLLSQGDKIPADGLLVEGKVRVDQSAMTGESKEVEKLPSRDERLSPDARSALLRECVVVSGECEMLVRVVGDKTFIGEISREITVDTRQSPLKIRLTKLASQISRLGYTAAVLVGVVYLFNTIFLDSGMSREIILTKLTDLRFMLTSLLDAFTLGLTIVVVAVPEGLPMMIAVVLSSNIKKMTRDMVLVRKPVGIEAAGSMNILFTDKTGTLTEGHLSVTEVFTDRECYPTAAKCKKAAPEIFKHLHLCAYYNTGAKLSEKTVSGGNATERALLSYFLAEGELGGHRVLSKLPFDSDKKYSVASLASMGGITLFKGAPERLLPFVTRALDKNGQRVPFDKLSFLARMDTLTKKGMRVLLAAFADGERQTPENLTLICGIAMSDRPRPEARASIASLRGAGIQVVMITGDNPDTARSIADSLGLLTRTNDLCLTSDELARMSDMQLSESLPRLAVIARALPSDKSRLVRVAQEKGLVCGMTGDGINDAPALKRADIGFSMGSGTQVAKEAGDIIILDNNLASIVRAVLYGRNIFKSIRKFIVLQLTMNLCAVGVTMICPFLGIDSPVTVVQMLWINVIMDSLGGLAFAGEPPLPSCMKEKPKRRDEPILNGYMVNEILWLGGFTVFLSLFFLKSPAIISRFRATENDLCLLTAFFAFFIFAGVFNCFNARTDRLDLLADISKNRPFLLIMLAISVIQIGFVYLGGDLLRTMPLYLSEILTALSMALLVFPAEFLRKLVWKLAVSRTGY
ncbi:MAG: calcium-translocating P-type ATPase, PMCA-type [Ruminococcaceae bacterium]|nr:calcium-translocating P-type ATPase, PMCA-type [Oscillospiraceae bacterium]